LSAVAEDNGPSDKVPELKVLDHYAGLWDTEITSANAPFAKGKVTAKWVVGGRFLQQTADMEDSPYRFMSLMTYDPGKKRYRTWIFLSDGTTAESEGRWDAKRKVMTSISSKDEQGGFSTTTADFSEPGVETWKIVYQDGTGNAAGQMSGKNTRTKEK
jgi:hypothetical protein